MTDAHPSAELITNFYDAFGKRDYATMASAYAENATFNDPVFVDLDVTETRAMWHMFCEQGKDLNLTASDIQADDQSGSARWEASYSFGPEGRFVHNDISAKFEFVDGLIVSHVDSFDLWKWTRMATGTIGVVAGWTPMVKNQVRSIAMKGLTQFIEAHPEYQ